MLTWKIYGQDECKKFIHRDKKKELEFKHPDCPRIITMSKNLEAYLAEFKSDPKRYNYDRDYMEKVLNRLNTVIHNIDLSFSIFLLPEQMSIVEAVDCIGKGKSAIVFFAKITPKDDRNLIWLLPHEIGHLVQDALLGIKLAPDKVWEDREHEQFANLFAEMVMRRINA